MNSLAEAFRGVGPKLTKHVSSFSDSQALESLWSQVSHLCVIIFDENRKMTV